MGKLAVKTSAESPKDWAPRHSTSICLAAFLTSMSCPNLTHITVITHTWTSVGSMQPWVLAAHSKLKHAKSQKQQTQDAMQSLQTDCSGDFMHAGYQQSVVSQLCFWVRLVKHLIVSSAEEQAVETKAGAHERCMGG